MPKTKYPIFKCLHRGEKGFTLVELLIVIAILGVLAAVIIPNIGTFMKSGKIGAARAELSTLQVAVDGMMADAGTTNITAEVTGWQGGEDKVEITVDSTVYDAGDYVRRSPTTGTFSVATTGIVTCTAYPDLDTDDIAKINA